jgi:adenine-specific DNA methylase
VRDVLTFNKRLIEYDLPLAEISEESAKEKNIRHGHPSTLHIRWARRPLAVYVCGRDIVAICQLL